MIRKELLLTLVFLLFILNPIFAPCIAFWNPDRTLTMDNTINWLSSYDENTKKQNISIELEFRGDASDFAILFATPSKPELYDVDKDLFVQLRNITPRPPVQRFSGGLVLQSMAGSPEMGITIVEVKDVGDFTATVLTADSTQALTEWLTENNYSYTEANVKAFDFYVNKPGFHFMALRINMDQATCLQNKPLNELQRLGWGASPPLSELEKEIIDKRNKGEEVSGCNIRGKLKPIGVEYVSEKPTLYTRIMGQNAKPMDITLYTIGKVPYYVPGTTVFYSQRITSSAFDNAQSIESFGGVGDWLTRSTMRLNFDEIDRDIVLLPGTDVLSIDGLNERPRIVNPDLMVKGDGVVNTHEYSELNFDQPEKAAPNGIGLFLFLLGDSLGGLAQVIGLIFPLLALMLLAPVSLLLFIFPITLGILFTRKKAALSTFLGTIVGLVVLTVLVTIIGSLYLFSSSISQSFYALTALGSLLIGSFILALIPASLFGLVAFLSSNYLRKNKFVEQTQNYFNKMPLKISAAFVALLVLLNVVLAILFVIVQNDSSNLLNPIPWLIVYAISFYGFYKFSQDFIKKYKSVKVELKKNDWHIFIILLVVFMIFQFGLAALFMGFPIF